MKTIILISLFAALTFSVNVSAKNVKTYVNIEDNGSEVKKEYITIDEETLKPKTKVYYLYDSEGNIQERTLSVWSERIGWVNSSKYVYHYLLNGNVSDITFTKWDNKKNGWAGKSDFLIHSYDEDGKFLSITKLEIANNVDNSNLITSK